jgi:hypothetical protein
MVRTRPDEVLGRDRFKRRFEALLSQCGDGRVDTGGGEDCEPPNTMTCDVNCFTVVPPQNYLVFEHIDHSRSVLGQPLVVHAVSLQDDERGTLGPQRRIPPDPE